MGVYAMADTRGSVLMRRFLITTGMILAIVISFGMTTPARAEDTPPKQVCSNDVKILGIPTWYQYLPLKEDPEGGCGIDNSKVDATKTTVLVLLALVDILTRVASMVAVGFVVYGGFLFVISQGDPQKIVTARKTVVNALIGLVIAILASQIVRLFATVITK